MSATHLGRLLKRDEFLRVASKGKKWVAPHVVVQYLPHHNAQGDLFRYGLTASRRVGCAVVRNKARRRLRMLAAEILPQLSLPQGDIVLIARDKTAACDFAQLRKDLQWCFARLLRVLSEEAASSTSSLEAP